MTTIPEDNRREDIECNECNTTGEIEGLACKKCKGRGFIPWKEKAGVRTLPTAGALGPQVQLPIVPTADAFGGMLLFTGEPVRVVPAPEMERGYAMFVDLKTGKTKKVKL